MKDATYLRTSHQISPVCNDGNRILLNGSGGCVTSISNIFQQDWIKRRTSERCDRLWDVSTGSFDGNIVVFFKVDTGMLLGGIISFAVNLLLHAHITTADNVFAVFPSAIAEHLVFFGLVTGSAAPILGGSTFTPALSSPSTAISRERSTASTSIGRSTS